MSLSEAFGKRDVGLYILNKDLEAIRTNFTIDGGNIREITVWGNNPHKETNIGIKIEPINTSINLNF